jgi:hypothetical protein
MVNGRLYIPRLAAIRVGGFVFDKTKPEQRACAQYILAAPFGRRQARMRELLIAGHQALTQRQTDTMRDDDADT